MTANPEAHYTIRNATVGDVEKILTLEGGVFPEGGNTGYWRLKRDIELHAPSVKLAILEDEIVGCIRGAMHDSEIAPGRAYGDIVSLGIAEEHRRRGLGELLLGAMIAEMQPEDPTGIMLHTRVSNVAMQSLAARFNFAVEATIENYYDRTRIPEDAYCMILRFPTPEA